MEKTLETKPISIYIPYAFLVTALLSIFITTLNKVELEPFKVEYPSESFLAPSFELESISGGKVSLLDYRGKIVFINFWAPGAAPVKWKCRQWKNFIKNIKTMVLKC